MKTRWDLSVDSVENSALLTQASQCGDLVVEVIA